MIGLTDSSYKDPLLPPLLEMDMLLDRSQLVATLPLRVNSAKRATNPQIFFPRDERWRTGREASHANSAREAKTAIRATESILYKRERNEATSRRLSHQQ